MKNVFCKVFDYDFKEYFNGLLLKKV